MHNSRGLGWGATRATPKAVSAFVLFALIASFFIISSLLSSTARADETPTCNGQTATIWVDDSNIIQGGPNNGAAYAGVLTGTSGDDVMVGTEGVDTIDAGNGENTICSLGGDDTIDSGSGDDWIDAGEGSNTVDTGSGQNTVLAGDGGNLITTGSGADTITTGSGNDTINAGNGTNTINAGDGNNDITSGSGPDAITSGSGDDSIEAGNGANTINAGNGDNNVSSGSGADTITTGSGNDVIDAGNGANEVSSGAGNDVITGGSGADTFNGGDGYDFCEGGSGGNTLTNCENDNDRGIIIVKEANPESSQVFSFTGSGTIGAFSLTDNGTDQNFSVFEPSNGTYTVEEDGEEGWTLTSIVCTDPSGDTTVDLEAGTATIPLGNSDTIVCVFTNEEDAGDTEAPDAPTHLSPADGTTLPSSALTLIDWTDVTDPSSPISYFYQSSNTSDTNIDGSFVSPAYTSGALLISEIAAAGTPEGTYFWHVRAEDGLGNSSAWTTPWMLTVKNEVRVAILKYIDGSQATSETAGGLSFPMHASWSATNIGAGSGNYSLGTSGHATATPYAAVTSAMTSGADYATYEVVDNITVYPSEAESCPEGKFKLAGYRWGPTLGDAEAADLSTDAPDFEGLTTDMYVIIENEACVPPPPLCSLDATQVIVSDETTDADPDTYELTPHSSWATIPGASWIWNLFQNGNTDSAPVGSVTFTKEFTLVGTPLDAELEITADNGYSVSVNGNDLSSITGCFSDDDQTWNSVHSCTIPADVLLPGTNTLVIEATNFEAPDGYTGPNPGGLTYELTTHSNECEIPQVQVHVLKYLEFGEGILPIPNESDVESFPMVSEWDADNIGAGSGSYVLGNYHGGSASKYGADTSLMDAPVTSYSTYEVTGGESPVLPTAAQCVPGKYRLVGYKTGTTLEEAENAGISTEAPLLTEFGQDQYIIVVNQDCADVLTTVTMCKFDPYENPLSGWTLTLTGTHIEDVEVPAETPAGASSVNLLETGVSYLAKAMGTWLNDRTPDNHVDAEYSTEDAWETFMDGFTGYGADILDLQVNDGFVEWGAYNSNHTYAYSFAGAGSAATFRIFDGQDGSPIESWYNDNFGSLDVSLYQGYAGITDENGCVVFENVPFGTYDIGETPQDGWTNVSGLGEVYVSDENNEFSIVNQEVEVEEGAGTLIIEKETTGGQDGTFWFEITGATATSTSVATTEGFGSVEIEVVAGTSTVTELSQEDWDFTDVSCQYDSESVGISVEGGYEIYVEDGETVTCTFINDYTGEEPTTSSQTIYVYPNDLAENIGEVLGDSTLWFFYNDETDTIDNGLGSFVTGPGTPPEGLGSVQISVSGTERRNLATYQFSAIPLAQITELGFSTYNPSAGNGGSATRSAYLNFNVDFDDTDSWQNRLAYVPSQNGTVLQDTWQEWDAINGGSALWWWSGYAANGNKWPDNNTDEYRTWDDLLSSFPNIAVRTTDSWLGLRVGEPYADGYTENLDRFVITVDDGSNATTTVFDFDPMSDTTTVITNAASLASNPSLVGDPYTVEWSVTSPAPGPITGTVSVTANGGAGCSAPVEDGSCDITPGAAGNYILVANYSGDGAGFAPSSSDDASHEVEEETFSTFSTTGGGGGGNGPVNFGFTVGGGLVLGTTTEEGGSTEGPSCSALITQIPLAQGRPGNNPIQVELLQSFLNTEVNAGLPLTGYFGPLTTSAVNTFQIKYANEVLAPWVPYGLPTATTPTGYVGKTTSWKINTLVCPSLNLPFPTIP